MTATELVRPAAESLASLLIWRFGDRVRDLRARQLFGHMLRHMMEKYGCVLDQEEVRIPDGPLFTRAARYRIVEQRCCDRGHKHSAVHRQVHLEANLFAGHTLPAAARMLRVRAAANYSLRSGSRAPGHHRPTFFESAGAFTSTHTRFYSRRHCSMWMPSLAGRQLTLRHAKPSSLGEAMHLARLIGLALPPCCTARL